MDRKSNTEKCIHMQKFVCQVHQTFFMYAWCAGMHYPEVLGHFQCEASLSEGLSFYPYILPLPPGTTAQSNDSDPTWTAYLKSCSKINHFSL